MARTHYAEVEVEYDISDFDDDELIEEIESRNLNFKPEKDDPLVYELFLARVEGNAEGFEKALKKLFIDRLNKTV
jgi:hypothetical protein